MTTIQAIRSAVPRFSQRRWQVGVAASLMLTASPLALHAEVSNAELAKEIAELKAQIKSLKGGVAEAKSEARRKKVVVAAQPAYVPPPILTALPPGATPVYATLDKKMIFGALTITPGGFIAAETVSRTRAEQTDFSAFNAVPFNNTPEAHAAENRFTARQSRAALLIESPISKSMIVSGYGEFDFLGSGTNSNNSQAFSYVPRIRNLYAQLDNSDYGFHVLAGQNWSLITLNSKGITPRNEVTPPQIDAAFIPGFEYARVPQIRITKDLFDKRLWLSLSAETSQTANLSGNGACGAVVSNAQGGVTATAAGAAAAGTLVGTGVAGGVNGQSTIAANAATGVATGTCVTVNNNGFNGQGGLSQPFSLNQVPDVVAKAAYEARIADRDIHIEGGGIYRDEFTNVNYLGAGGAGAVASTGLNPGGFASSSNQHATGWGVVAGLIVPVLPKRLDFQASGLFGRGLAGRFASSAGLPDAAVNAFGRPMPIGYQSGLVGFTLHATPAIDIYAFAGIEQLDREFSVVNGAEVGYGLTNGVNNNGCNVEGGTCTGQTHRIFQITGGLNDKLYKGTFGELRVGVQYSYTQRQFFGATSNTIAAGATAAAPFVSAKADDNTVLTSLRYYPFQ